MYGKIFESMYDGTLVEDWRALITFQQMIVLCDSNGIIDITHRSLSSRTGIPIEHINAGIDILEAADPYSRSPEQGGKRISRIDEHRPWGWYIINFDKYNRLISRQDKKQKDAQRMREKRKKDNKINDVAFSRIESHLVESVADVAHVDVDVDVYVDEDIKIKIKPQRKNSISLPDWLNFESWAEFVQHRKDIKKPLTHLAAKKNLAVLEKFKDQQKQIIDTTIANRWTGLFSLKNGEANHAKSYPRKLTAVERVRAAGGLDKPGAIIDVEPHGNLVGEND